MSSYNNALEVNMDRFNLRKLPLFRFFMVGLLCLSFNGYVYAAGSGGVDNLPQNTYNNIEVDSGITFSNVKVWAKYNTMCSQHVRLQTTGDACIEFKEEKSGAGCGSRDVLGNIEIPADAYGSCTVNYYSKEDGKTFVDKTQTITVKMYGTTGWSGVPSGSIESDKSVFNLKYSIPQNIHGYPKIQYTSESPRVCSVDINTGAVKNVGRGLCAIRATNAATGAKVTQSWIVEPDMDGDGIPDAVDNCPNIPNPTQEPSPVTQGADGSYQSPLGKACNNDYDNDGVANDADNCPMHYNPGQEIDLTTEAGQAGFGIACAEDYDSNGDEDGDGIANQYDNCPFVENGPGTEHFIKVDINHYSFTSEQNRFDADGSYNPNGSWIQKDTDQDGVGDACDSDIDGDDVLNETDNCPYIANPDQLDSLGNGVGDACRQVFVKPEGSDSNDCTSWDLACKTVERGIEAANDEGLQSVFIAEGEYSITDTIQLSSGVQFFAGLTEGDVFESEAGKGESVFNAPSDKATFSAINQNSAEVVLAGFSLINKTSTSAAAPALYIENSRVTLRGGKVANNSTTTANTSAAIVVNNATLNVSGTSFEDNSAIRGGAVYSKANSTVSINSGKFKNNSATDKGAAIYQENGQLTLISTQFEDNQTKDGTVAASAGDVKISGKTVFKNNTATGFGAAVDVSGSAKLDIAETEFVKNIAAASGGAMALQGTGTHLIQSSIFEENKALHGGAIYFNNATANPSEVNNNIFFKNEATTNGGAVYMPSGVQSTLKLRHNTFVSNKAASGGAINSETASRLELSANLIAGNTASDGSNLKTSGGSATGAYNLIGADKTAGISGNVPSNTTTAEVALKQIVSNELVKKGGDGYQSALRTLPIIGGGPARDLVPSSACTLDKDMRGEKRPDNLSNNKEGGPFCDAGAYEFTALSCEEDAARRYAQGELFIKSCDPKFENIEINLGGSVNYFILLMLSIIGGVRLYRRK